MWGRTLFRSLKPRFAWTLAAGGAATAIALTLAALLPPVAPLTVTAGVSAKPSEPDTCIDTTYEGLGGIDVAGPISIQGDRLRPRSGEELTYREDIKKLVEEHNTTAQGKRYVLSMAPDFAILCERDDPKKCRVRHLRTQRTLQPSMAVQILFQDIVRAHARLQDCRFGAHYL
jgi:hypothetical protein